MPGAEPGLSHCRGAGDEPRSFTLDDDDGSALAVALSGGSDSLALLHLVCDWRAAQGRDVKVVALTVDHGLRAESAAEAAQVAAWCAALGVAQETLVWRGAKPTSAIQARARAARYALMLDWCRSHGVGLLLTGHTADDQAETVAMRQRRSGTALSLAAIWRERRMGGVRVVRPLLGWRRAELQSLLRVRGQAWLDDPANRQERFERVRLRRALAGDDPAALVRQAAAAQAETEAAVGRAHDFLARHALLSGGGYGILARDDFLRLDGLAADLALEALLRLFGAGRGAERAKRAEVLRWLAAAGAGRRTLAGALVTKRRHDILVVREAGRMGMEAVTIPPSGAVLWDGRFVVTGPPGAEVVSGATFRKESGLPAAVGGTVPWLRRAGLAPIPTRGRFVGAERLADTIYERVILGIALSPSYLYTTPNDPGRDLSPRPQTEDLR